LVITLVLAVALAALLANYVYFRYRVSCIGDVCANEKAAIVARVVRDGMKAFKERLAFLRESVPAAAPDDKIATTKDDNDSIFLLVDSTGDWVLVLIRSNCGTVIESRDLSVGLWTHSYDFESPRVNFNLASTKDGRVYRNDGHICMLTLPDEGSVEKFFQIDQSSEASWNLIASNPGVERPSND
jgi:hypothetical protein